MKRWLVCFLTLALILSNFTVGGPAFADETRPVVGQVTEKEPEGADSTEGKSEEERILSSPSDAEEISGQKSPSESLTESSSNEPQEEVNTGSEDFLEEQTENTLSSSELELSEESAAQALRGSESDADYKFRVSWDNPVNATTAGYSYEDGEQTILSFHDMYNKLYAASVAISFNLVDTGNIRILPERAVKITIPSVLFRTWAGDASTHWDGKADSLLEKAQMQTQLPEAPAVSDSSSFSWEGDPTDCNGTITIFNSKPINGSKTDHMVFSYHFLPTLLGVDTNGDYSKTFEVGIEIDADTNGTVDFAKKQSLTVKAHTETRAPKLALTRADKDAEGNDVYFNWQPVWGPKPADADDFFYVVYRADLERFGTKTESSTQPFSYRFENLGSVAGEDGELAGAWCRSDAAFESVQGATDFRPPFSNIAKKDWQQVIWADGAAETVLNEPMGIDDNFVDGIDQKYLDFGGTYVNYISSRNTSGWKSFFLLMRYPNRLIEEARANGVDMVKTGINVHNQVKVTQIARDGNPAHTFVRTADAEANVLLLGKGQYGYWKDYDGRPHNKSANSPGNAYGAQTALLEGKEAPMESGSNMWGELSFRHTAETRAANPKWDEEHETYTAATRWISIADRGKILSRRQGSVAGNLGDLKDQQSLSDADIRYKSFRIYLSEYDGILTKIGLWEKNTKESSDYAAYRPAEVYIRKQGERAYTKYAEIYKRNRSNYEAVYADGTSEKKSENQYFSLPDNVVDVRFAHESKFFATRAFFDVVEYLQPTASVKAYVQKCVNDGQGTLYTAPADFWMTEKKSERVDLTAVSIPQAVSDSTDEENTVYISHSLSQIRRDSSVYFFIDNYRDNAAKSEQRASVILIPGNRMGRLGDGMDLNRKYVKDSDLMQRYAMNKGVIYNLLPAGTKIDPDTLKVGRHYLSTTETEESPGGGLRDRYSSIDPSFYTVEYLKNYKNSGATMVKITIHDLPEEEKPYPNEKYGAYDYPQYSLFMKYDLINSYGNIRDRGTDVVNTAAFVNTSDGEWDPDDIDFSSNKNPATYRYFQELADSMRDPQSGSTDNFGLCYKQMHFENITIAEAGTEQQVRNLDNGEDFGAVTEGVVGNHLYTDTNYQYRLAYYQEKAAKGAEIVFYDILDQAIKDETPKSQWQGTFTGVDLSAIAGRLSAGSKNDYADPKLFYATEVPTGDMNVDDSIWHPYPEDDSNFDKTQVKAIAIDVRKAKSGKPFVLAESSALVAFVNMKAPSDESLDQKYAVNEHQVKAVNITGTQPTGQEKPASLYAACKLTLHKVDLALTKASDPKSGTEEKPAEIANKKGEKVTYTLTVRNTNDALPLQDVVVEDLLPEGLNFDLSRISASSTAVSNEDLQKKLTQTLDGRKLQWTIKTLERSESVTFTIPTELSEQSDEVKIFENCAEVIKANERTLKILSDTTWHSVLPRKDLTLAKKWEDENQNALKEAPVEKVTIGLYRNGNKVQEIALEASGDWKAVLKDLEIFDPKTREDYDYTVKEEGTDKSDEIQFKDRWYKVIISKGEETDFLVTNRRIRTWTPIVPATRKLQVSKAWEGLSGENAAMETVRVQLLKNGEPTDQILTLNADNHFTATFENLKDTDKIDGISPKNTYSVRELQDDGKIVEEGQTLTIGTRDYSVHYEEMPDKSIRVVNTLVNPKRVISGEKIWKDANNQDGKRPESVTMHLLADGKEVETLTVREGEDAAWRFAFPEVPTYDAEGNWITWTVTEDPVPNYETEIQQTPDGNDAAEADGAKWTVVNTHEPERLDIPVQKLWVDGENAKNQRPQSVQIRLFANGKSVEEFVLKEGPDGHWTHNFRNLPRYEGGKEIEYTLAEVECKGYTSEIRGDAAKGFEVINTEIPEPKITKEVSEKTTPKTGDQGPATPLTILAGSAALLLLSLFPRKKERNRGRRR